MRTCCQTAEVYVTPGDVRRIEEHTGQNGFYEFRQPENQVYVHEDVYEDPVWQEHVFREDGSRRVVKRQESGDCTFLGPAGCVLPLEIRPLICRIYPFDYDHNGLLPELAKGCPVELLRQGQDLIAALEMDSAEAKRWHRQLYAELLEEKVGQCGPTVPVGHETAINVDS
jgi:Fe-S-cluster containining protein